MLQLAEVFCTGLRSRWLRRLFIFFACLPRKSHAVAGTLWFDVVMRAQNRCCGHSLPSTCLQDRFFWPSSCTEKTEDGTSSSHKTTSRGVSRNPLPCNPVTALWELQSQEVIPSNTCRHKRNVGGLRGPHEGPESWRRSQPGGRILPGPQLTAAGPGRCPWGGGVGGVPFFSGDAVHLAGRAKQQQESPPQRSGAAHLQEMRAGRNQSVKKTPGLVGLDSTWRPSGS